MQHVLASQGHHQVSILTSQNIMMMIIIFILHLSISRQNPRGCGNSQV